MLKKKMNNKIMPNIHCHNWQNKEMAKTMDKMSWRGQRESEGNGN